jgi:hypothetical protein
MTGIEEAIAAGASLIDGIVRRIWPDATEVEKLKLEQLAREMDAAWRNQLAQLQINMVEAANPSLFVAGWRPFTGWLCGLGFGYEFLFRPLVNGFSIGFSGVPFWPAIESDALISLLFGLLGMGGLRTFEKTRGVARS